MITTVPLLRLHWMRFWVLGNEEIPQGLSLENLWGIPCYDSLSFFKVISLISCPTFHLYRCRYLPFFHLGHQVNKTRKDPQIFL